MRKLIVSTYAALDGVIENPMWTFPYWSDDIAEFQTADLFASDALLMGRETYEAFYPAWSARAGADAFADRVNAMQKYVASRTLKSAEWNGTTIIKGDVVEALKKMKQQPGMNILKYGAGGLMHTLIENDLMDELHVLIYPLTVGNGEKLFRDGFETKLKLLDSKTFSTGVVALIYAPDKTQEAK